MSFASKKLTLLLITLACVALLICAAWIFEFDFVEQHIGTRVLAQEQSDGLTQREAAGVLREHRAERARNVNRENWGHRYRPVSSEETQSEYETRRVLSSSPADSSVTAEDLLKNVYARRAEDGRTEDRRRQYAELGYLINAMPREERKALIESFLAMMATKEWSEVRRHVRSFIHLFPNDEAFGLAQRALVEGEIADADPWRLGAFISMFTGRHLRCPEDIAVVARIYDVLAEAAREVIHPEQRYQLGEYRSLARTVLEQAGELGREMLRKRNLTPQPQDSDERRERAVKLMEQYEADSALHDAGRLKQIILLEPAGLDAQPESIQESIRDELDTFLQSQYPSLRIRAVRAAGLTRDTHFLPRLEAIAESDPFYRQVEREWDNEARDWIEGPFLRYEIRDAAADAVSRIQESNPAARYQRMREQGMLEATAERQKQTAERIDQRRASVERSKARKDRLEKEFKEMVEYIEQLEARREGDEFEAYIEQKHRDLTRIAEGIERVESRLEATRAHLNRLIREQERYDK